MANLNVDIDLNDLDIDSDELMDWITERLSNREIIEALDLDRDEKADIAEAWGVVNDIEISDIVSWAQLASMGDLHEVASVIISQMARDYQNLDVYLDQAREQRDAARAERDRWTTRANALLHATDVALELLREAEASSEAINKLEQLQRAGAPV